MFPWKHDFASFNPLKQVTQPYSPKLANLKI